MKVYILNEYRNCGDKDNNFGIIEYEVDEKIRWCNL